MGDGASVSRGRNPERTRRAILDAAEDLFAAVGYEATTLQAIGARAGISRGTPGYFFGSKQALYAAVLDRFLAEELKFVSASLTRASTIVAPDDVHGILDAVVGSLLEFLAARPNVVRLMEREALSGGAILRATAAHAASLRDGLAMTSTITGSARVRPVDPATFLLSVVSLCWFPFAHAETYARDLGLDPRLPADRERWRRQVVDLLLRGIRAE